MATVGAQRDAQISASAPFCFIDVRVRLHGERMQRFPAELFRLFHR
jgi:hypothetical protein